jgi:serine/threonine-protein phosphatase 2A regulatory subunit B''
MCVQHHDEASQFVCVLTGLNSGRRYLVPDDFVDLIQDVVNTHPGLTFLTSTPEFHARYVETVIERIFYTACHNWHYRLSVHDLRKSKLLQAIKDIENEPDINQELNFFSYEHFYVLYCKFWELDTDHDLMIDAKDLSSHDDHVLCPKIVNRLLSGIVTSKESTRSGTMSYREFVWFLLSEEDKTSWRSTEYWFRVLDIDGDGYLSLYELEYFYGEMLEKMENLGIEGLPLEDSMCQVIDMINPKSDAIITLNELKHCKMAPVFFNTFVNVDKYLDYEQRDPVANNKAQEMSDWEKYAAEQYDMLIAEEEEQESDADLAPEDKKILSLA